MIDLKNLSIKKVHEDLKNGKYKVSDLVDCYLKNIKEKNKDLNIYLSIFDDIEEQVEKAQKKIDDGEIELLTGVPVALKANIAYKGGNTSAASKILENYISSYDATVVKKLREKGVIFLGYVNMDEFACGGSTENSAFGPSKNPLDPSRVPGGSSGGSAAAVAADMALVSLGTDTGGSIRQPAAFCGLVGVKPTYGRVSRFGAIAMGSSLDQISPITKNLEDNKIILEVISGKDDKDMTSLDDNDFLNKNFDYKKRIAYPKKFIEKIENKEVLDNFNQSIEKFKKEGYEVVPIDFDYLKYALSVYYIIMPSELSSNLARYDGIRYGNKVEGNDLIDEYFKTKSEGFGEEIKRRIVLGTYSLSAGYEDQYYNKANSLRIKIKNKFLEIVKDFDGIIMPTTPEPAFKLGEKEDPLSMYLSDIFTVSSNIIGNPSLTVPSGFMEVDNDIKMPLGLQILTDFNNEALMYKIAEDFLK